MKTGIDPRVDHAFLTHGAELGASNLPSELQAPILKRAMEVLNMLSQNDVERERYRARLKWERDQTAFIDEAHEIGREEGEWIGRIHVCQKMLKVPVTPRSELCSLPIDDLRKKAEALEKQLGVAQD